MHHVPCTRTRASDRGQDPPRGYARQQRDKVALEVPRQRSDHVQQRRQAERGRRAQAAEEGGEDGLPVVHKLRERPDEVVYLRGGVEPVGRAAELAPVLQGLVGPAVAAGEGLGADALAAAEDVHVDLWGVKGRGVIAFGGWPVGEGDGSGSGVALRQEGSPVQLRTMEVTIYANVKAAAPQLAGGACAGAKAAKQRRQPSLPTGGGAHARLRQRLHAVAYAPH